jgi:hypothetical protein
MAKEIIQEWKTAYLESEWIKIVLETSGTPQVVKWSSW